MFLVLSSEFFVVLRSKTWASSSTVEQYPLKVLVSSSNLEGLTKQKQLRKGLFFV